MDWNGKTILYREDWEEALRSLSTPDEAAEFTRLWVAEQPEHSLEVLGYMTGEIASPEESRRVQDLLGVKHPYQDLSNHERFILGFYQASGEAPTPPWFRIVFRYPRRDPFVTP